MPVDYSSQIDALCSARDNEKKAQSGQPEKHWYDGVTSIFSSSPKPVTVERQVQQRGGSFKKGGKRKSRKGSKKAARKSKKSRR